jgi:hypothetical protein
MTKQLTQDEWELLQDSIDSLIHRFHLVASSLIETHTIVLSITK